MRAAMIYGPDDIRVEDRPEPTIVNPTDALIRLTTTCVCGSDLWPYRGIVDTEQAHPMGHEYVGVVEVIGTEVTGINVGDHVVGSFMTSDNTCEICADGYQSRCLHGTNVGSAQAEKFTVENADGTLVPIPGTPTKAQEASLMAASDVLGTGWFGAKAAEVGPGKTVAVVGDGAVGLLAILAASQLGADRIIAMSRHADRQKLAREFGATDIVAERGDQGVTRIKELTNGLGAHSVIEAVGTQESFEQAIRATRPGGHLGFVGVGHEVRIPGIDLFFAEIHVHGGPAPVREHLPHLVELIMAGEIDPGKVFDLEVPLEDIAEGYAAMDERRAIKALVRP